MIIKEIVVKNLYGFLTKNIRLDESVAILVGINGSGKTSVLNLITWGLTPSLHDLCTTQFDELTIRFEYLAEDYVITYTQDEKELKLTLINVTTKKEFKPVQATFKVHPKQISKNEKLLETIDSYYKNLGPEDHERLGSSYLTNSLNP